MGRIVDSDELVGTAEIATRLGVGRPQVVHDWRRRHPDFPEPIATLSHFHIWTWPDVAAWAEATGRI